MDWDLEAIVRGSCTSELAPAGAATIEDPYPGFSFFCSQQDELPCSFPEFSETTVVLDELEEMYKPFYPALHPLSTQTIVTASSQPIPQETEEEVQAHKASDEVALQQDLQVPAVSKFKRSKKKPNKRVVKQVTAKDGVCDAWAWRKYGQKPIKGSPYPRSYYRCSSSKGCMARKQVERSHLDPGVFLITYTAEHSHPHPTRKNALAGCTRKNGSSVALIAPPTPSNHHHDQIQDTTLPLSPRTDDEVEPSVQVQQSKGLKKQGEDFDPELLDDSGLEELIEVNRQLALDGCGFMDHSFAETWFLNESNLVKSSDSL